MRSEAQATEEGIEEVVRAWSERCRETGCDATACEGVEARFLLSALASAVVTDAATRELGRAARGWGDRFSSPVEALSSLTALREVLVGSFGEPVTGWTSSWLPISAERYNRIVDQLTTEAVDSASSNLQAAARTDALTGCANRLALQEDLDRQLTSARRSGLDLAVAMIDLDGLKQINDGRGHEAGDLALTALAATLQGALRGADRLYRIGGDEFVVLLPFTDAEGAKTMLRRAETMHGPAFSWGVSSLAEVGSAALDKPEMLLASADAALYAGRAARRQPAAAPAPAAPSHPRRKPVGGLLLAMALGLLLAGVVVGLALPQAGPQRTRSALGRKAPTLPQLIPPVSSHVPASAGHSTSSEPSRTTRAAPPTHQTTVRRPDVGEVDRPRRPSGSTLARRRPATSTRSASRRHSSGSSRPTPSRTATTAPHPSGSNGGLALLTGISKTPGSSSPTSKPPAGSPTPPTHGNAGGTTHPHPKAPGSAKGHGGHSGGGKGHGRPAAPGSAGAPGLGGNGNGNGNGNGRGNGNGNGRGNGNGNGRGNGHSRSARAWEASAWNGPYGWSGEAGWGGYSWGWGGYAGGTD